MGSTVENRPRKSTLSKIGKIFGVSDKSSISQYNHNNGSSSNVSEAASTQHQNQAQQQRQQQQPQNPNHPNQNQNQQTNNYTTNPRSNSSGSNPNSLSSLNSSSSSVNQMVEFEKPKTPSRVSSRTPSRPPSRASSINHKHQNASSSMLNDDLSNLKLNSALKSAKKQQQQKDQQLNLNSSISEIPNNNNNGNLKPPTPNTSGNASSSQAGTASPSMLSRSSSSASTHHNNVNNSHTHLGAGSSSTNVKNLPRFVVYEDGSHEHHLKNAKRQEKLSNMLKNLLGAQKLRDEAVSAVPDILSNNPPSLFSGLVNQFSNAKEENFPFSGATRVQGVQPSSNISSHSKTFAERYGRCQEVIGKGTFGVVRISHKKFNNSEKETLFAVKEFKKKPTENEQKYSRRLTSEFCISSSLKHVNIIETLDLLQDAKGDYVEVMEFCSGGDLYTLIIAAGKLEYLEADCFFKQLIRGVVYMHEMGVAHRDLKPENLLLTENGILKITDFGNGECFKMAWEKDIHFSGGVCGSSPYIAPEEYTTKEFDPRSVDIWACGVIYMAMRTGRQLWRIAKEEDEFYRKYLEGRKSTTGYEPIEHMKRARCRNVIYSILDPVPSRRINGKQILNSEWGREIKCCI